MNINELKDMKLVDLKELAKEKGIHNISKYKKSGLIEEINPSFQKYYSMQVSYK